MATFLRGLSLQFFRGIGPEPQRLFPFHDFNFFVGTNNSGKSTMLDAITRILQPNTGNPTFLNASKFEASLDSYRGDISGTSTISVPISLDEFCTSAANDSSNHQLIRSIRRMFEPYAENECIWIKSTIGGSVDYETPIDVQKLHRSLNHRDINEVQGPITGYTGGNPIAAIEQILSRCILRQKINLPEARIIPAVREITGHNQAFTDFSGRGLISRLAEIQSPDHHMREEKHLFDKINAFLASVTGSEGAQIEVPHHREHIIVHMDNKVLPLHALGTGIQEVIMIAAFCTLTTNKIICIEEPEIHLHPVLQRKLISFLRDNTDNQYFIATHSAALIDTPDAAIFHVTNDSKQTRLKSALLPRQRFSICSELGYKASDIIQSNAVIWVEGPSDRIYLRHWIKEADARLIEGIHYSIMFYGGKLLSHLSADSEEVNEFIDLQRLNRNIAIVIDSDKSNSKADIRDTKKRIVRELSDCGVAWVTKGREVENYLDFSTLQGALKILYSNRYFGPPVGGSFSHALYFKQANGGLFKDANKVRVAKLVCESPAQLDVLDLRERVSDLVSMIHRANHIHLR